MAEIDTLAYIGEKNPLALAKSRGEQIKDFLIQLGVKPEHIYVDAHIIKEPFPLDRSTGRSGYLQLGFGLSPWCKNGCQHLCDDPRVTPTTRVIK
ncbi:hypothetical protein ACS7SF_02785 [Ralstonia sp. 25C]|uniref:hypothetical protein n=1 Tax=Ralstonia sp. 25C TaxID=3447363 RepID=UPI003F7549C2